MKLIHILSLIIFLNACGENSNISGTVNPNNGRNSILGTWVLGFDCVESYNFSNTSELWIFSNEEFVRANYNVTQDDIGRDTLEFNVFSDNFGADCMGDSSNDTGVLLGPFYVEYQNNLMRWYDLPTRGNLLATLDYVDDSFYEPLTTNGNTLSLVALTPTLAEVGTLTQFSITLDYETLETSEISIGFNDEFSLSYTLEESVTVTRGNGQITLSSSTTPFDWGEGVSFYMFVQVASRSGVNQREVLFRNRYEIELINCPEGTTLNGSGSCS